MKQFSSLFLLVGFYVLFTGNCKAFDGRIDSTDILVHNLINNYLELFSITDQSGVYHQYFETQFRNLFTEDGEILNFHKESPLYNQIINLDRYISSALVEAENKIIRPGVSEFHISERVRLDEPGVFIYQVYLNKVIHFYSKLNYENLYDSEIKLHIDVLVDLNNTTCMIRSVKPVLPNVISLDYNVYFPDRRPAQNQPVIFSYFDDEQGKIVKRKRYTNHRGHVRVSNIPHDAEIKISAEDDLEVILDVTKTAHQWNILSEKDRFIILGPRKKTINRSYKPYKLRVGTKYHFPVLFAIIADYRHYAFENPIIELQPDFDYYFIVSRSLLSRPDFGFALGYGIEYNSSRINIETRDLIFFNPQLKSTLVNYQSDNITGIVIKEQYHWQGVRFPFFLTWIYHSNNRFFESFDLSLVFRYHMSPRIEYSLFLEELADNDPENPEVTGFVIEGFSGKFIQSRPLSIGAEMAFNFNIYNDVIILQYSLAYGLSDIGNYQRSYFNKAETTSAQESYAPFLKNKKLRYYNLALGLGLAIKF